MQLADAAWYSPASGSFWADMLALGCIVATVVMARLALPRRSLSCIVVSRSRLIDAPQAMQDDLKVSYQDDLLNNPYVVALEIANTGRSAIPTKSFDDDRSLQLNFTSPILKILSIEYEPTSAPKPTITATASVIELKPGLIAKHEVIRASLLMEGATRTPSVALDPFSDVKIRTADREASEARRSKALRIGTPVAVLLTVVVTTIAAYLSVKSARTQTVAVTGDVVCLSELEYGQSSLLAVELAYRDISVSRSKDGHIHSIIFARSYSVDVGNANYETQLFAAGTQALESSGVQLGAAPTISADDRQATTILRRLSKEGNSAEARMDLTSLSGIVSRISNPDSTIPKGC
jgi:hypothetical protein